jgi:DNA repair protein RecN (Recombination protein N)
LLKHLHIRDFAVIEELEVQFDSGMTVFTGETGAGKSIIVDALGLVMGDRADSSIIRHPCESTEITAIFDVTYIPAINRILDEQGIQFNDEVILRRVVNRDGRSRAYVNGTPSPAQLLREIGEYLVDIYGQHAHQSLLKRDVQRSLLDDSGEYREILETVRNSYQDWSQADRELAELSGHGEDHDARLALLQYQVQELEALAPEPSETEALEEEHKRLANASRIMETAQKVLNLLSEDEAAISNGIDHVLHEMQGLLRFDQGLSPIAELLENASIQINEAANDTRHYLETMDLDPVRLREVEDRISALHDIARKHKVRPEELADHLELLQRDLETLEGSQQRFIDLGQAQEKALQDYRTATDTLHNKRKKTAKGISLAIEEKLKQLGMPGGKFQIEVSKLDKDTPMRDGLDRIEYLVAINPGQSMQPLSKVASGGELSRISLAIQVIGSKDKGLPTLIFDEVDSGIGGGVAEIVGKLLHSLAGNRQVFCVTHLPQVASLGDHHLLVNKSTHAETTLTQVVPLSKEDRVEEIARMLGGLKVTDQSRAHAREMLEGN